MMCADEFHPDHKVLKPFIKWIEQSRFDPQHATNWGRLYCADPEAAMCEATAWALLRKHGVEVEPNADLTGKSQRPDFRCAINGVRFYAEVTCIQRTSATSKTGLPSIPTPDDGASHFQHLNDAIFGECVNKATQCANLDAPCVLIVGTFHFQASAVAIRPSFIEWLVTGEPSIAWNLDAQGNVVGDTYQLTKFQSSVFTRLSTVVGVEDARRSISALLVCGFGCNPPSVLGVLHPNPAREFDPTLLIQIPFCCQNIDLEVGHISAEWIQMAGADQDD